MTRLPLLFAALCLALGSQAIAKTPRVEEINAVMQDSAAGWNSGDLDRFMAVYSDSPRTSFVTGQGLLLGKAAIAQHYRSGYDFMDPDKRGTLTLETRDFRVLGPDSVLYIARYSLVWANGKSASGVTSVVLQRERKGWRIVADHSS